MGTPQFAVTVLEALLRSSCQLLAVCTQPDKTAGRKRQAAIPPVKKLALERGIPVIQPGTFRSGEVVEKLRSFQPELIVVAAFGYILPPEVLALPAFGCLNVHASLLPRHRGPSPVASAILCGDVFTGVTIMLMDAGLDTGPILAQEQVGISSTDDTGSLSSKLGMVGAELLVRIMPAWVAGEIRPQSQDESQATYSKLITSEDGEVDWCLSALEIWRRIRALRPWPGCYTWWGQKRLKIHEAVPLAKAAGGAVGEVIALDERPGVGVVTGQGVLGLCRVQLEGRRDMRAPDFVHGRRDFLGSVLGRR